MKRLVPGWFRRKPKKSIRPISIILMYHRVANTKYDPWKLCVSPQHFSEHMDVLRKFGCLVPLNNLIHALLKGKIPERSVAITFDDGYLDNLSTAKPLLERFGIPATFFVSTGCIQQQREFWWDELERIILHPILLPESLHLTIRGEKFERKLNIHTEYQEEKILSNSFGNEWEKAPDARLKLYYSLWRLLKQLENRERDEIINELQGWAGTKTHMRLTHRVLKPEQIRMLFKGSLFDVGSHSVSHAPLPSHSLPYQKTEINDSKRFLENLLDSPIMSFSYPHGESKPETIGLVKDAGFLCACSAHPACVFPNANRFLLPRFEVPDCDGGEFENKLLTWFAEEHA